MHIAKRLFGLVCGTAMAAAGPSAMAATACQGPVSLIDIEGASVFATDIGFGWWILCDLSQNYAASMPANTPPAISITPSACQAMLTGFMTSKAQNQHVRMLFTNAGPTPGSPCNMDNSYFRGNYPYAINVMVPPSP